MKKNTTKRALIMSMISLLVCVSMLIGTTYAWFTDSVTSGANRIVAGNLKVDLVMDKTLNDNYVSIAGGTGDIFKEAAVAQNSNATLWEPGKTQIVFLGVRNLGNLALKYNLKLNITDIAEHPSMVQDGYSALEYAIIDGAKAANLSAATAWTDIAAAAQVGDVTIGSMTAAEGGVLDEIINGVENETDYFALAVHMKEGADNRFQNAGVQIDVALVATQQTAEADSFDNQYDAQAEMPVVTIMTETASAAYSANTAEPTTLTTPSGNAEIEIPAGVSALDNSAVELVVAQGTADPTLTVETGNSTTTYDVSLRDVDTKVTVPTGDTVYTVKIKIGVVDLQHFYHHSQELTKVDSIGALDVDKYYYDQTTGYVTFKTKTFSPFTSEYLFAGGIGTEAYPYLIEDRIQMQAISNEYQNKYAYYKWIGASSVDASGWTAVYINGSFDGNGVVFNNLDQQLFRSVGTASTTNTAVYTIENVTVNANINISGYGAAVLRQAGNNLVVRNVTVHGRIEGNNGAASFVCFGPGNLAETANDVQPMNWKFINCVSDANIVATGDVAVGFVKHPYSWASQHGNLAQAQAACLLTIEDSIFKGTLTAAGTSEYKAKYFVGNGNDLLVKTVYSDEFIAANGNPEGISYATPTAKTSDGVFFVGNYPGEGKKASGYSNYGTCMDKYLMPITSITVVNGVNPEKYNAFTVAKIDNAVSAKVTLEIAPNDSNNYGSYLGTYMTETIDLAGVEGTFNTNAIKYFDITINGGSTSESGLTTDGHTYNVVNDTYGTTFNSATVRVSQISSDGNVLGVTVFNIKY